MMQNKAVCLLFKSDCVYGQRVYKLSKNGKAFIQEEAILYCTEYGYYFIYFTISLK